MIHILKTTKFILGSFFLAGVIGRSTFEYGTVMGQPPKKLKIYLKMFQKI